MTALHERRFSVKQAAFITRLEEKGIDRFIFEAKLRARQQTRELDARDLFFLEICREHQEDLTPRGRERIYEALHALDKIGASLTVGALELALKDIGKAIRERADLVQQAEEAVVEDPDILGGEPVIRGTRIPARNVAAKLARGATVDAIVRSYPTLDPEKVELAKLWVELNPKRGRPARRTWRGR